MQTAYLGIFIIILIPIFIYDIFSYIERRKLSENLKKLSILKANNKLNKEVLDKMEESLNKQKNKLWEIEYKMSAYKIKKMRVQLE